MAGDNNKNPWGRKPSDGNRGPWGTPPGGSGGSGGSGGDLPPDIDELLRKAQDNLRRALPGGFGPGRLIAVVAVAAVGLWLASGFYLVRPGENAVITQFGAWTKTQSAPGLGYRIPWPVQNVDIVNTTVERRIQIGFSEGVGRNAGKRDIPEESLMLTSDANIVDLDLVVFWNIDNARDYLFNILDQEQTIKKVAESAIREVVGQTQLQPIITGNRTGVAESAKTIMQNTLNSYKSGVSILGVVIQEAVVHPDVIEAYEDVVAAQQDAERFQNEANIYANDIVPKARGESIQIIQQAEAYKESQVAKAKGDADRFTSIYSAYTTGPEVTRTRLYLETMEEVLKNAQKIIIDENASGSGVVPFMPLNELKPAAGTATPPAAIAPSNAIGQFGR
ncbi:MAG: FtsH protease activity modulator HflK [Micavibrio sp.]